MSQPASITLTGSGFLGDADGSGGSFNSSPTNYPLLMLRRVDSDQTLWLSGTSWSDSSFTSATLSGVPNGYYRASIVTGGIPSIQRLILVADFGPPSSLSATATSASQVSVSWAAVIGATSYEVYRSSSINGPYLFVASSSGAPISDTDLAPDTTYLYKVRALNGSGPSNFSSPDPATTVVFSDANLSGVPIQAVHFAQLRTAVNAMRAAANLPAAMFTDDPLVGGATTIRSQHVIELRSALDQARTTLGLPAISYTDSLITADSTPAKAAHITELRAGTQ